MNRRALRWIVPVILLAIAGTSLWAIRRGGAVDWPAAAAVDRPPRIRPDYRGVVIPPNVAPLNFVIDEPGTLYAVRLRPARGEPFELVSRTPRIVIPRAPWRRLLDDARGRVLEFEVGVRDDRGRWTRFAPIGNTVADAEIDPYLVYRLIRPVHIIRENVNIYQRDVRTYEESVVASNYSFKGGCINCHSFAPNHPDRMILHARGADDAPHCSGMILAHRGEVTKIDTRAVVAGPEHGRGRIPKARAAYTAWHPNGRVAAFSANRISQFFHAVGETRDVFDRESDLALYHVESNTVTTSPKISRPERLETFPNWSPDGRRLYFVSTDPRPFDEYREIRYDLMRIAYDPESGTWGKVEMVLSSEETGMSITEPRVSPNGRWLLFCMSEYGAFPPYQPSSDLYLLDLETGEYRRLDCNSPRSESWHCWSRNSRWIAFASKRRDGTFARVYFSYIDETGRAHKPVLLPQKDPTYYDRLLKTYNVPELRPAPAPATPHALARTIRAPGAPGATMPEAARGMEGAGVP